jgi:hypothetical protein
LTGSIPFEGDTASPITESLSPELPVKGTEAQVKEGKAEIFE